MVFELHFKISALKQIRTTKGVNKKMKKAAAAAVRSVAPKKKIKLEKKEAEEK